MTRWYHSRGGNKFSSSTSNLEMYLDVLKVKDRFYSLKSPLYDDDRLIEYDTYCYHIMNINKRSGVYFLAFDEYIKYIERGNYV